jgi:hypothetical protein
MKIGFNPYPGFAQYSTSPGETFLWFFPGNPNLAMPGIESNFLYQSDPVCEKMLT